MLHVFAQNAGIFLSAAGDDVLVEVFEVSPMNQHVISTRGRLQRAFPASGVYLQHAVLRDPSFREAFASTVAKMSQQRVRGTQPKAKKAAHMHDEDRDTTHPEIVTEFFISVLAPLGRTATTSPIWKNTRDEVFYYSSLQPWRRSPLWLVIRVALQLLFSRFNAEQPGDLYKEFMIFGMAKILSKMHHYELHSDFFLAMSSKIRQRLLKTKTVSNATQTFVRGVLGESDRILKLRWSRIQKLDSPRPPLSELIHQDIWSDTLGRMPGLDEFIDGLKARRLDQSHTDFEPGFELAKGYDHTIPLLNATSGAPLRFELIAFETWVASRFSSWLDTHRSDAATSRLLRELIEKYHQLAEPEYWSDPESTSLMILTILELWVGCDEASLSATPLLREYDPAVPTELFQSLLLPFKQQMKRLSIIEGYLANRAASSTHPSSDVLRAFGTRNSFSTRYYQLSPEHQELKARIESWAAQCREEKETEFQNKKTQHRSLMSKYESTSCQMVTEWSAWDECYIEKHYATRCTRCGYLRDAEAISLHIHEWPLPPDPLEASSTVFELLVPQSFGNWRDATMYLQSEVLGSAFRSHTAPRSEYTPANYKALSMFFKPFREHQRIKALSEDKPHEITHRKAKKIGRVTQQDVCLRNALHYRYYDQQVGSFVEGFSQGEKLQERCTYKLPIKSSSLQKFLHRGPDHPSGPSPNTVIASQSTCPQDMPLGDFKALCTIPLGYRIQWQNILVQLQAPSMNLNTAEATFTLLQCVHQAGPRGDCGILRESHAIIKDIRIIRAFLSGLHETLRGIQDNWKASNTLFTLISLACRIQTLAQDACWRDRCLEFLKSARETSMRWLGDLCEKLYVSTDDGERTELCDRILTNALICSATFHLGCSTLEELFCAPREVYVFLRCSVLIQETKDSARCAGSLTDLLYRRWQRLSYRTYQLLAERIVDQGDESLDGVIHRQWPAYQPFSGWRRVSPPHDNWLTNNATTMGAEELLAVHFNLLNGELLVNGVPLSRLPREYENHRMYRVLFGKIAIEVMPTTVPGMRFSAKKKVAGYTLHFGMSKGSEILVQAQDDNKQTHEFVPRHCFERCLPTALVEEYVHWYNVESDTVVFCRYHNPWDLSFAIWVLRRTGPDGKWYLETKGRRLVDVRSKTARIIAEVLKPLEDRLYMHCSLDSSSGFLEIELPRLQLGFYMSPDDSQIYSRQYRGMCVDKSQLLGSLVGLHSKLVLQGKGNVSSKMVLIPHGTLSYEKCGKHVLVHIDKCTATRAYAYRVDSQLGRLFSDGGLLSRLWLCYLHALTSFCLPDTLTGRTGTEEALSILGSAAVKSFGTLTKESMEILAMISCLTPRRRYYPAHERVMQVVEWDSILGFLAQHGGFHPAVQHLLHRHTRYRIFQPDTYVQPPKLKGVDCHLLARDDLRSSTFRVAEFGAEKYSTRYDMVYPARDQWRGLASSNRAAAMSKLMYSGELRPLFHVPQELVSHIWGFLAKHEVVENDSQPLSMSELGYDARWLSEDGSYIARNLVKLHLLLSRQGDSANKFGLTIWLSSLAYGSDADMPVLYTLSAFRLPSMESVIPPKAHKFTLSKRDCITRSELVHVVQQHCVPLHQSPEASIPRGPREKESLYSQRKQTLLTQNRKAPRKRLVDAMVSQWPCWTLDRSKLKAGEYEWSQYYHTGGAVAAAEPLFKAWHDNRLLRQYINELVSLTPRSHHQWHMDCPSLPLSKSNSRRTWRFVTVDDLFTGPAPGPRHMVPPDMTDVLVEREDVLDTRGRLLHLIEDLKSRAASAHEERYVAALRISLRYLGEQHRTVELREPVATIKSLLQEQLKYYKDHVNRAYSEMLDAVGFSADEVDGCMKQWPRLSPVLFLQQLCRTRWHGLSEDWKRSIVQYALALSYLQQTTRRLGLCANAAGLIKDLSNTGHTNWDPHEYPETLLLEIESGITIREVQEQVSQSMIAASAGHNQVMQLHMGEGKSSVIAPKLATVLADGAHLFRIIVGRAQAQQMLEMLIAKLGGLINRPIFQLPFSRDVQPEASDLAGIQGIFHDCIKEGGVLLIQPEHILSFKLMALERMISGKEQIGRSMLESLEFLNEKTRDIVDESDENFSIKFELIYTLGLQQPIDNSPYRWVYIHEVLEILRKAVPLVYAKHPDSIEVTPRCTGSFPRTRILTEDAEAQLLRIVATQICENGLYGFPVSRCSSSVRSAVYNYITLADLTDADVKAVEESSFWSDQTSNTLLLLRGLLAERVLMFVFSQKRWRVDYGLVHDRRPPTRLAVPYKAKDRPSPRSEFSHPEVVMVLTSLSYYYGGLTDNDLFEAFHHLCRSDQADMEYQAWVRDASHLPKSFQQLRGLNLEDRFQCTSLVFPCFKYAKAAVDYFLSHIVFPKEMKEFPHKLTASGWDLGEKKKLPTTGFSGTNDSRVVLPLSVQQLDLPEQQHTNALVLTHLLRPEMNVVAMDSHSDSSSVSDAERLLLQVMSLEDPVRVIIDVGAQILELNNLEVAQKWLSMFRDDESTRAAVFFDDYDRICVLDRHGTIEPLHTSPYAGQLDACLVFLDEAHTRGTDLKLPQDYRAAVTLGTRLTKDRLVQGSFACRSQYGNKG